eukprot:scaffold155313_cov18-Prasinocladus_malaysianus.AAC.1
MGCLPQSPAPSMPKRAVPPCHSKSSSSEHQTPRTSLQIMPVAARKRAATHAKPGPCKPAKKFCYYPKAAGKALTA